MGYGRGPIPDGRLPVFSTDTEEEAERLLVATCPLNLDGHYYAPELADEQTLENLQKFSDRLAAAYERIKQGRRIHR